MLSSPGVIAFTIAGISVHYYGICLAIGIVFGLLISYKVCKKYFPDIDSEVIFDVSVPVIVGGIIGARLYYCCLAGDYYFSNPLEILKIYNGGLSIHGAIIGGLLSGILYAKKKSLLVLKLCDIFTFALVTGQIVGRFGNFFNSEAFGIPCQNSCLLKLYIPVENRPFSYINEEFFHPTFLYESLLNFCILCLLLVLVKRKCKNGVIFFVYLILYSLVRICIESLRTDSVMNIGSFHIAHIVCFVTIVISLICLVKILKKS